MSEDHRGRVVELHRKAKAGRSRGLPKPAVPELDITAEGVAGDYNRWRTEKAAGDPDQAVLLLSEEILVALRAEGWPVERGDLGENLTVADLPLDAFEPGGRVEIGAVILEISKRCDPCIVLYSLPYVGMKRGAGFLRALKGRRGWFARVIRGGAIHPDLPVLLRPSAELALGVGGASGRASTARE